MKIVVIPLNTMSYYDKFNPSASHSQVLFPAVLNMICPRTAPAHLKSILTTAPRNCALICRSHWENVNNSSGIYEWHSQFGLTVTWGYPVLQHGYQIPWVVPSQTLLSHHRPKLKTKNASSKLLTNGCMASSVDSLVLACVTAGINPSY